MLKEEFTMIKWHALNSLKPLNLKKGSEPRKMPKSPLLTSNLTTMMTNLGKKDRFLKKHINKIAPNSKILKITMNLRKNSRSRSHLSKIMHINLKPMIGLSIVAHIITKKIAMEWYY
jgi:hypothetical protein